MESLKSDLKSVQGVIKDLVANLGGELPVASWKFPEKLAASLDPLEVLQSRDLEGPGETKTLLMELLVDRLMFLLQCCVRFSEKNQGQKFASLPLTLGSTVKKFSRKIQQDHIAHKKARDKVLAREQHIAVLESTVTDLQTQRRSVSTTPPPVSTSPRTLGAGKPLNPLSSSTNPLIKSSSLLTSSNVNVSTQTTETGFALCVQCSDTHATLANLAQAVSTVSSAHQLPSALSARDWVGLASIGGLEIGDWAQRFKTDLKALSNHTSSQECRVKELEEELMEKKDSARTMEDEMDSLKAHINHLQTDVETVRRGGAESLARTQRELGSQLSELRATVGGLEMTNSSVREELARSRKQEAMLKARMAEIEGRRADILNELRAVQSREMGLLSAHQTLETELERVTEERARVKEALEETKLELAKTKVASQTREKKNKALVSKQGPLLTRLDQLDEECGALQERLWGVESEREELRGKLADMQTQCVGLKGELASEKEKLSESVSEGERLKSVCCELEEQVKSTLSQLNEEKERCRLLMDYPFVKQTSPGYADHINSMSTKESQKHISANTVRILLLEEQNSELRGKSVAELRERGTTSATQLRAPVRMWRDELLTQVHSEQALARRVSSAAQSSNERGQPPARPRSLGSRRGRLGHLATAIADHRKTSSN